MATLTIKKSWQAELRVRGTNLRERGSLRRAGSRHPQYICLRRTMTFPPPSSKPVWTPRPPPRLPRLMFLVSVHRRGGYSSFSVHRQSCLRLHNQNCLMALRKKKCNTRESEKTMANTFVFNSVFVWNMSFRLNHIHMWAPRVTSRNHLEIMGKKKDQCFVLQLQLQTHCLIQNNRI